MKLKMLPIMLIVLLVLKLCLAISCNAQNLTLPFHGYIDYDGDAFSIANAGSGTWANGIVGSSSSVNGKGIYGLANSNLANITNYGGYFEAKGGKARAVYGEAKNSGNVENYGGYFLSKGYAGFGAYGKNESCGYSGYIGGWYSGAEGKHTSSGCTGTLGHRLYGVKGYHGQSRYSGYLGTENYGVRSEGPLLVKGGIRVEHPELVSTSTAYPIMTINGPSGWIADFWGKVVIRSRSTGNPVMELGEGLDYGEGFNVSNKCEVGPGVVLVIDADNPGNLTISDKPYDSKVAGIVSGAKGLGSGVRLGASHFDYDIALAGRVYCNVDATYGEVAPGDLLTTSPTPGYAMAVKDYLKARGAILGKAMEKLEKGQKGQIMVLVTLQ